MSALSIVELAASPEGGRCWRQEFTPDPPGAGLPFRLKVPGEYRLRPVSVVFTLTTSAVAGNRYATVEYLGGDNTAHAVSAAAVAVTAGSAQRFAGSLGRGQAEWSAGTDVLFPLVDDVLEPGGVLAILVAGIDAGDALTGIRVVAHALSTAPPDADEPGGY